MDLKEIINFIKEHKKAIILGFIFLIVIIPATIYLLLLLPIPTNNSTDDGWLSFWGSFLGGMFGGIGTLIALVITTIHADKQQNKNLQETQRIQNENNRFIHKKDYLEDVKRNKPMLILNEIDIGDTYVNEVRFPIGFVDFHSAELFEIQNVGLGVAKNISITFVLSNGSKYSSDYFNIIPKDRILKKYYIRGEFDKDSGPQIRKIILTYRDIFENIYFTIYTIEIYEQNRTWYFKINKVEFDQKIGDIS